MNILVIDVGGTHVKVLATGVTAERKFDSGPDLSPKRMVTQVRKLVADWNYDVVTIGYPGPVWRGRPVSDPWNLGKGWVGFDFAAAFQRPVKVVNDAAMQALGSYRGGKMLFLGLGTGLGSALIVDGILEPLELGHLPYKKATFEDYVGIRGIEKHGKKKWRRQVADVVQRLVAAVEPNDVVLGGGNVKELKELPAGCRAGDNANAFLGGFRLWEEAMNATSRGESSNQGSSSADRTRSSHSGGRGSTRAQPSLSPPEAAGPSRVRHIRRIRSEMQGRGGTRPSRQEVKGGQTGTGRSTESGRDGKATSRRQHHRRKTKSLD